MKQPRLYVNEVFEDASSLEEIMVKAIKLEVEASNNYGEFLELPLPDPLRKKLKTLKFQEEQHEKTFRSIFKDFFPNREPVLPKKSGLSSYFFEVTKDTKLVKVLARAKHSEKEFELFYDDLIDKFGDKHIRSLIGFLAASEREHYEILSAEFSSIQEANQPFALLFITLAVLYGLFLSVSSLLLEELTLKRYEHPGDKLKLMAAAFLENFGFRQLHALWRLKGLIDYIRGSGAWGEMVRESLES